MKFRQLARGAALAIVVALTLTPALVRAEVRSVEGTLTNLAQPSPEELASQGPSDADRAR